MNWYLAKIVLQIRIGNYSDAQFDIQHRLISATDTATAMQKARRLGMEEESDFTNEKNETVSWKFAGISELHPLPELHNGMQLHSSTFESEDPASFILHLQKEERIKFQPGFIPA